MFRELAGFRRRAAPAGSLLAFTVAHKRSPLAALVSHLAEEPMGTRLISGQRVALPAQLFPRIRLFFLLDRKPSGVQYRAPAPRCAPGSGLCRAAPLQRPEFFTFLEIQRDRPQRTSAGAASCRRNSCCCCGPRGIWSAPDVPRPLSHRLTIAASICLVRPGTAYDLAITRFYPPPWRPRKLVRPSRGWPLNRVPANAPTRPKRRNGWAARRTSERTRWIQFTRVASP